MGLFGQVLPIEQPLVCLRKTGSVILGLRRDHPSLSSFTTLVQDWKAANGYAVYRLDMEMGASNEVYRIIQMYMMYTLIHDDSYGMLQHGLNLQPNFPVWSIGILFMTWSCPSRTSWSKGTKIQFAQASGIWSECSEWPPWKTTGCLENRNNYHSSSWNLLRHFSHLLSQLQTPHCRCVVPSILRLHHLEHQWHTNPDVFELSI